MAKGDDKKNAQAAITSAQSGITNQTNRNNNLYDSMFQNYQNAQQQQMGDYSNIMNQFSQIRDRPDFTMNQQYKGNVDQALAGYGNFAQTGGFSPEDIQNIRARSVAPTRAVYANAQREVGRQSALAGGYAPNMIAARAKMAREQGQAVADANTNTNAGIAQMVQQGKLAGMSGLGQLGSSQLGLSNQIDQQNLARLFGSAEGMRGMYGTNPALANMFGNQALMSAGQGIDIGGLQNQLAGLQDNKESRNTPWWKKLLAAAGTAAPYVAMAMSSRELKDNIEPIKPGELGKKLSELPIYTWNYKGDSTKHIGPVAEEFQEKFGVGDGKSLHLVDVMGVMLGAEKERLAKRK